MMKIFELNRQSIGLGHDLTGQHLLSGIKQTAMRNRLIDYTAGYQAGMFS